MTNGPLAPQIEAPYPQPLALLLQALGNHIDAAFLNAFEYQELTGAANTINIVLTRAADRATSRGAQQ